MHAGGQLELAISFAWAAVVAWLILRAVHQRELFDRVDRFAASAPEQMPYVTVLVPVRDESANIVACLQSLLAQHYPPSCFGVLVIDDDSSDDTALIVTSMAEQDARLKLLRSPALPMAWIGKSHACWTGARAVPAQSQWLCFIDADVRGDPAVLASAVRTATSEGIDLLSLAPRHELGSFAERLILPCGLFLLAFHQDLQRLQARDSTDATATGQFMLVRRAAYEAVGGHAAVPGMISEDVALARLLKREGYHVVLRAGDRLLSTRMYTGWCTLWPGLAKNLVDMLGGTSRALATVLIVIPLAWAAVIVPAFAAFDCASSHAESACTALGFALLGSVAAFGLHVAGAIHFRIPFWYGPLFPLGYTMGALMVLDSLRRRLRGRVSWKGRTYP
jgi:chlorobactene glucosyltransferase